MKRSCHRGERERALLSKRSNITFDRDVIKTMNYLIHARPYNNTTGSVMTAEREREKERERERTYRRVCMSMCVCERESFVSHGVLLCARVV